MELTPSTRITVRDTVIETVKRYNKYLQRRENTAQHLSTLTFSVTTLLGVFYLSPLFIERQSIFMYLVAALGICVLLKEQSRSVTAEDIYVTTRLSAAYAAQRGEKPIRLEPILTQPNFIQQIMQEEKIQLSGNAQFRQLVVKSIFCLKTLSNEFYSKQSRHARSIA